MIYSLAALGCRLAVLLALRSAAARAILAPKEPAAEPGFIRLANLVRRVLALMTTRSIVGPKKTDRDCNELVDCYILV